MEIILEGKGFFLRVRNGLFEAGNEQQKQQFHPEKVQTIKVSKGGNITTDAIFLALEHTIEFIFLDYFGNPKGRIWNNKFGSIATIRKQQLVFSQHPAGTFWACEWLIKKIKNQHSFLGQLIYTQIENPPKKMLDRLDRMVVVTKHIQQLIQDKTPPMFGSLRGWEGTVARIYFQTLSQLLPTQYQFEERSGRNANDMFNVVLNYLYGILYSLVEGALLQAGIDPAIGIWHVDEYNKPVLSYDFIEPYRVWADIVLVRLCLANTFVKTDFEENQKSWRISKNMKKAISIAMQDYLDEVVLHHKSYRSRKHCIKLDAQNFAQKILKFNVYNL